METVPSNSGCALIALGLIAGFAAIEGGVVLIAAFPDLALAGWFVLGWAAPQVIGKQAAGMLVGVMVLEFFIIHASIGLIAFPRENMARWGITAGLYLLLTAGSIFIPVPRLAAISGSRGDGLWEQHPEQAVMMGALYFALLGFCELYGGFNKAPAKTAPGAG